MEQSLSMETHVWQALPQRKKRKQEKAQLLPAAVDIVTSISNISNEDDKRSAVQHQQKITDNVTARSVLQRANATLESLDGCAGEFYECAVFASVTSCVVKSSRSITTYLLNVLFVTH